MFQVESGPTFSTFSWAKSTKGSNKPTIFALNQVRVYKYKKRDGSECFFFAEL